MTSGLNGCGSEDNERFTLGMAHCDPLSRDSNQMGSQDQPDPIALAQSDVCHLSAIRIGVGMDAEVSKENRKSDMEMEIAAINSPRSVVMRLPVYTGQLSDFGRTFWAEIPASWLTSGPQPDDL